MNTIINKLVAGIKFISSGKNKIKRTRVMVKRFFYPDHILHVFIEITNICNARCVTCLQSSMKRPRGIMPLDKFKQLVDIIKKQDVAYVHLYGIGESYTVKKILDYFVYALPEFQKGGIDTILITNGELITELPQELSEVQISFNAGKKESYERITGLNFEKTVKNIKRLAEEGQLGKNVTIRMLASEETKEEVEDFAQLFSDVNCTQEVSYKFDNQHGKLADLTEHRYQKKERVPCNYVLNTINICWNGDIILCPHDFEGEVSYGNIFKDSWSKIINFPRRKSNIRHHQKKKFQGLCYGCNYNVPLADQLKKIKKYQKKQ